MPCWNAKKMHTLVRPTAVSRMIDYQTAINTKHTAIAGILNLLQSGGVNLIGAQRMRTTALVLVAIAAISSFCAPASGAAKIYKWTDANGQVHFDSSPPPGQVTEKVQIRKGVDAPPVAPADSTPAASATTAASSTEKIAMSPQQRAELSTYCNSMRERISVLKQGGSVVEKNPDGSSVALDSAAVTQKLSADEANVRTYCVANGL